MSNEKQVSNIEKTVPNINNQVPNKHFWNWYDKEDEHVLYINGTIAESTWFEDDVTPAMFKSELQSKNSPITIWLNSPGGDCVAASQIYTMLMDYPHDITVKIDGVAASAASVIAMAGTRVLMSPTSLMMIHNPATIAFGDHTDMQKAIDVLDTVKESIINAYEIKTGLSRNELSKMMDEETWFDAYKAVELRFADGVLERNKTLPLNNSTGVVFSQRTLDMALVNRIKQTTESTVPEPVCIPIEPLYERLERLKH